MLKLNEFSHNHHPTRVKMLAKYIGRGISVPLIYPWSDSPEFFFASVIMVGDPTLKLRP
jgi:hypothetical protein